MTRVNALQRHRHRLDVYELTNSFRAELASEPGTLGAAERQSRIGCDHAVNEDHAGFELLREELLLGGVGRPGGCAEPKRGVVRKPDCFSRICHPEATGHRAEDFLAIRGRLSWNVCEHSRLVEKTGPIDPLPARE